MLRSTLCLAEVVARHEIIPFHKVYSTLVTVERQTLHFKYRIF
jgi:hypothetical protein